MQPPKPKRVPNVMQVVAVGRLSPHMIRVTLSSDVVQSIPADAAGANCKLFLPNPGEAQADFAARLVDGPRPVVRTYTIRNVRPERGEIDIDFVDHGDVGPASAWARAAAPGQFLGVTKPGLAKITSFHADYYVLAADMSALPMAAATLEAMPHDAKGIAYFEITDPADVQRIDAPEGIEIHWLEHPKPHVASRQVIDRIENLPPFQGRVQTCIAGESSVIQALRAHLLNERKLNKEDVYLSGYWKIGLVEDEHQKIKRALAG